LHSSAAGNDHHVEPADDDNGAATASDGVDNDNVD
jgi:hypothetical protein